MLAAGVLVLAAAMTLATVADLAVTVFTAPAAAPVAVAAAVLGPAAEVFGDGGGGAISADQLAAAADQGDVTCDLAPAEDPATAAPDPGVSGEDPDERPQPIALGRGGSISREDVARLVGPLPPGTSTLTAHVWFLYRLAGLGSWDRFAAAYTAAGLRPDEDSPNAPLRQVQALNSAVSDMERYRLTAAALAAAGELTGRLTDPYPRYRELVSVELVSSCMTGTGAEAERMTLPPPETKRRRS